MVKIAVVGATGLVGKTFLKEAQRLQLPFDEMILFASPASEGKVLQVDNFSAKIHALSDKIFEKGKVADIVFFCAGSEISERYVTKFLHTGSVVIDNSSRFRMEKDVPLVAVEVNFDKVGDSKLIANPNCSTLTAIPALNALKPFGLQKVRYVTFQSASGAGRRGLQFFKDGNADFFGGELKTNCIPKIGDFDCLGNTQEELKMQAETKKILQLPYLDVSATCVRVPIEYCHAVAVEVELKKDFCVAEILSAFEKQANLKVAKGLPLTQEVKDKEYSVVGRIRKTGERELSFFCVADNLCKGASSNAILIAKKIIKGEKF